jgi:hypothetical protein
MDVGLCAWEIGKPAALIEVQVGGGNLLEILECDSERDVMGPRLAITHAPDGADLTLPSGDGSRWTRGVMGS